MLVQFLTNDQPVFEGFNANFHYIPIEQNCVNWLDMTAKLLKSPDYPTIDCTWVITAPSIDNSIKIHLETFEVNTFD